MIMTDKNELDPNSVENVIARLSDNDDLVDIMISIEDYLDTNDLYSFKNWINGEIVDGPYVRKYWVKVTLKWVYEDMPDPDGALRLLKHGTKVFFRKSTEKVPVEIKSESDYESGTRRPKMKTVKIWLVDLIIPRKFVESISKEVMDLYGDEVDTDTADQAVAQGQTPDQAAMK